MDLGSVNASVQGQAYGQDAGVALRPDQVVTATVIEKLDNNLYILDIGGKFQVEARVMSDLKKGEQYQLVVDSLGEPPEFSVVGKAADKRDAETRLTPEEDRFLDKVLAKHRALGGASAAGEEISKPELLALIKSLGYDTNSDVLEVYESLKSILPYLRSIDAAPPAVRQALGQTLLYNMESFQQLEESGHFPAQLLENALRLSGEIPRMEPDQMELLSKILNQLQKLNAESKNEIIALLLGSVRGNAGEHENRLGQELVDRLESILKDTKDPEQKLLASQKAVEVAKDILGDSGQRFLLASALSGKNLEENPLPGFVDRAQAIYAYQKQAPALLNSSVHTLLEQFVSLGGRLDKLEVGEVLNAQQAWKGQIPSAMQLHRTAAVLSMTQELASEYSSFQNNPLISRGAEDGKMPILLNHKVATAPINASAFSSRIKDFSASLKLPSSLIVEKFFKNWMTEGNNLAELRSHLPALQAWNGLVEAKPDLYQQLAEYLFKGPIFKDAADAALLQQRPVAEVAPEVRQALSESMEHAGLASKDFSSAYINSVQTALAQVAGEGQTPTAKLVETAVWLMDKRMEVSAQMLKAVTDFHSGHRQLGEFVKALQGVPDFMGKLPKSVAEELKGAWLDLQSADNKGLKETLAFYQSGDGKRMNHALEQARAYFLSQPDKDSAQALQIVNQLSRALTGQEEYLAGLKQYNAQAFRQDTPQVFEIPIVFGDQMDKAWLRIYKRGSGSGSSEEDGEQKNYKIVIDLNLTSLGRVRTELSSRQKQMSMNFTSPTAQGLEKIKLHSKELLDRMEALDLDTSLSFKQRKIDEGSLQAPESKAPSGPGGRKLTIDFSA